MFLSAVEEFLKEVHKQLSTGAQGVHAIPTGLHIRDDEQVKIFFTSAVTKLMRLQWCKSRV